MLFKPPGLETSPPGALVNRKTRIPGEPGGAEVLCSNQLLSEADADIGKLPVCKPVWTAVFLTCTQKISTAIQRPQASSFPPSMLFFIPCLPSGLPSLGSLDIASSREPSLLPASCPQRVSEANPRATIRNLDCKIESPASLETICSPVHTPDQTTQNVYSCNHVSVLRTRPQGMCYLQHL